MSIHVLACLYLFLQDETYRKGVTLLKIGDFLVSRKTGLLQLMPTFDPSYIIICNARKGLLAYMHNTYHILTGT